MGDNTMMGVECHMFLNFEQGIVKGSGLDTAS